MTHLKRLKEMFEKQEYVKISDLRSWCNYRSRIADLRSKYGMRIKPIVLNRPGGDPVHAYKLIRPLPTEKQGSFLSVSNHDGRQTISIDK